jgi:hypothetical protein
LLWCALDPDNTAVSANKVPHDVQSEPLPTSALRRVTSSHERLEDLLDLVCRHPRPVIADGNPDAPCGLRDTHLDFVARRPMAARVGEQVDHHLSKLGRIADDHRRTIWHVQAHPLPALRKDWLDQAKSRVQPYRKRDGERRRSGPAHAAATPGGQVLDE